MTARDRILSAIRAALPQERPAPDAIAAEAKALLVEAMERYKGGA